ncbi:MAG: DUF3850 domain-containing protein [Nitrospirae bacterium]|nr:DUF3850 domain-containing protein [Nitrospirota bacterium]
MTTHELKCWPVFYQAILDKSKLFEIRKNDRDFHVGDLLLLKEYEPVSEQYTGRETIKAISYILSEHSGLQYGYVIMALKDKVDVSFELFLEVMLNRNPEIDKDKLFSSTRKREYVIIRNILAVLLKLTTKKSLNAIGLLINRDHACVIHGCQTIANLYDTDAGFRWDFDSILTTCGILVSDYIKFKDKPVREYLPV